MFYSLDILVKKNGRFALIWQYIHERKRSVMMRKELMSVDVKQSCKDLEKYIPLGKYSKTELTNKMSLYLLAQLFYGIVSVHNLQASAYLDSIQQLAKSLLRVPQPERTKRQRADGDDEDGATARKRRITRPNVTIVLDVTQPRAYMEERHQVLQVRDPLLELDDDNFEVRDERGGPAVLDWNMEGGAQQRPVRKVSIAEINFGAEEGEKQPRMSVAEYLASPEALRRPTGQFDVSGLQMVESARRQQLEYSRMQELTSPRLVELSERYAAEHPIGEPPQQVRVQEEGEEEDEEFILEPFIKPTPARRRPRQPRARTYRDEDTELSAADVKELAEVKARLVRTTERALMDMERPRRVLHQRQMIGPHPKHLTQLGFYELKALFGSVLDQVRERALSFQQATRVTPDELRHNRRLEFEIVSWESDGASVEAYTPWAAANGDDQKGAINGRTVHVSSLSPSVIMPGESRRPVSRPGSIVMSPERAAEQRVSATAFPGGARTSSFEPARRDTATPIADESGHRGHTPPIDEGLEELQIAGSPPFATVATQAEEGIRPSARRLLQRIEKATVQSHGGMTKFSDVCPDDAPRKERALEFFNLLNLLKHREIKVKQNEPYGRIGIKRRGQSAAVSRGDAAD